MNSAVMTGSTTPVVEQTTNVTPSYDPADYEIRWGMNPIQRDKLLNPRATGIAGRVPFCKWFAIKAFPTPREIHTIDWSMPKEADTLVTAAEAQLEIEVALAGKGVQQQVNWGFVAGFLGERDAAVMEVISQTLFPRLSVIREVCANLGLACPISPICESMDETDYGERESCPSCWNKWLNSDALQQYIAAVANTGMEVLERETSGELKERVVKPRIQQLEDARMLAKEGMRVGLQSLRTQWDTIAAEYTNEKSGRKDITEFEHQYRKDLHQIRPQDRQVQLVSQVVRAARGENVATGDTSAIDKLVSTVDKLAQIVLADRQPQSERNAPVIASDPVIVNQVEDDTETGGQSDTNLSPGAQALKTQVKTGNKK
jgi:hypothetical protein